jgi:hypothetical protein
MIAGHWVQLGIALTGVVAIRLSQDADEQRRRFACLFGLAGQPFWIWSAWSAEQYGILLLTAFYTWAWAKGVCVYWLKRVRS